MIFVFFPAYLLTCASLPTAKMRPPRIATAWAMLPFSSTVTIFPPKKRVSAFWIWAAAITAVEHTMKNLETMPMLPRLFLRIRSSVPASCFGEYISSQRMMYRVIQSG